MNPGLAEAGALASSYSAVRFQNVIRIVFPPHPYLVQMSVLFGDSGILLGGQDCHDQADGAHTGDVSGDMLAAAVPVLFFLDIRSGEARMVKRMILSQQRPDAPLMLACQ